MRRYGQTATALCAIVAVWASTAVARPASPRSVVINLAGDVGYPIQFGRGDVIDRRRQRLFEQVQPIVDSAHLNFANLECAFTHRPPSVPGMWPLSCPPERLSYAIDTGFNVFSLANNHMMDAAVPGVLDTIAGLRERIRPDRPLWWTGAGKTSKDARQVLVVQVPGTAVRIAWLAVASAHPEGGIGSLFDPSLPRRIRTAAKDNDLVIVSVHYGTEHLHVPSEDVRQRYRRLAEAGADVVVGHHPHVMQGIERHQGGVILYSLGDLSFGSMSERHVAQGGRLYSLIARLLVDEGRLSRMELIPLFHDNSESWTLGAQTLEPLHGTPRLLAGPYAQFVLDELDRFTAAIPGAEPTRLVRVGDRAYVDLGQPIEDHPVLLAQQRREYAAVTKLGAGPRPATAQERTTPMPRAELRSYPKPGSLRGLPKIH